MLFVNGLLFLGKVDPKSAGVFNLFVGALQTAIPFWLISHATTPDEILGAAGIFLFGFTYLYVGIGNLKGYDASGLGWYSLWVAVVSELDMLTDAAVAVLAEAGLGGLSISAIARRIGVTPPALTLRWREDDRGARARILQLVVLTFGERWHLWSRGPLMDDEPSLSLPATPEEAAGVRAWLALRALARAEHAAGNPDLNAAVAAVGRRDRDEIREMVRSVQGQPLSRNAAAAICAFADGLRTELACDHPSIDAPTAGRVLRTYVATHRAVPAAYLPVS